MRITFATACRNSLVLAVVFFIYMGFEKSFDVFGWYGVPWSLGDWVMFAVLAGFFPLVAFGEWWSQRRKHVDDSHT